MGVGHIYIIDITVAYRDLSRGDGPGFPPPARQPTYHQFGSSHVAHICDRVRCGACTMLLAAETATHATPAMGSVAITCMLQ